MNTDLVKQLVQLRRIAMEDPIASARASLSTLLFHLWLLTAMLRRAKTAGGGARSGRPEHRIRAQTRDAS
jgi:hypothetical protein